MVDTVKMTVRGFHCDVFRHVNHTRYLEFMEEGTWSYWDERPDLVRRLDENRVGHSIVNININYRRGARMGDRLRVETRLARVGRKSITFEQKVLFDESGEAATEAELTVVFFRTDAGGSVAVDDEVFQDLVRPAGIAGRPTG